VHGAARATGGGGQSHGPGRSKRSPHVHMLAQMGRGCTGSIAEID
jgi:hypothetical protein